MNNNNKYYTRGGQTSFLNLYTWFQVNKVIFTFYGLFWLTLSVILAGLITPKCIISQTLYYHYANFLNFVGKNPQFNIPFPSGVYKQSVQQIMHNPYFVDTAARAFRYLLLATTISFVASFILATFITRFLINRGKNQTENQFIRGASLIDSEMLKKQIIKQQKASDLNIDKFPLIHGSEVLHLLIHGTVGMGKSQFIMKLMDGLRKRGDRVIVYDKGCTFTESFFEEGKDVLLNPYDARCANWDLWLEAPQDALLENMAESLIPMHGENDPFWVNAARTVFSSTASTMRHDKEKSLDKLLQLLVTGEFDDLEPYLKGTAAATLVSNKIEKTAISIRSVITTYLKSLQSLMGVNATGKPTFSIRDYILNEENTGWLFISSNGEQHKSLKPLISMWIAMASLTLLSLTENSERRIWFICDELPSLHKLPLLGETIAEVRKFGGCFLLGMQSYSQLVKVYGRSGAQEIFDLLNTRAFFASPSHEMAQLVSKELGEEEIEDTRENYSYGINTIRDGISLGKNRVTRPLVTYPEIMDLDPLTCYMRLPGHFPITKLNLTYQKRKTKALGFIPRIIPDTPQSQDKKSNCLVNSLESDSRMEFPTNAHRKSIESSEIESIF